MYFYSKIFDLLKSHDKALYSNLLNYTIMLDIMNSINDLISSIYECQKKIILDRRFIHELQIEGKESETYRLQKEIQRLQEKILQYQAELSEKYHYSY